MELAAVGNFPVIKKGVILFGCCLNSIMLRGVGLNDNLSP
ncbi:hypothetical protein ES703_121348 [subsurface metagenome]